MGMKEKIEGKLRDRFDPQYLEVIDESAAHAGHAGAPEGGESHFRVIMTSGAFAGQTRVARQRAVYQTLEEELAGSIHALALALSAPEN